MLTHHREVLASVAELDAEIDRRIAETPDADRRQIVANILQEETTRLRTTAQGAGKLTDEILRDAGAAVYVSARETRSKPGAPFLMHPEQLLGGRLLSLGFIAQMLTGEGKTVTAVIPLYTRALLGKGIVSQITTTDAFSRRDLLLEDTHAMFRLLGLRSAAVFREGALVEDVAGTLQEREGREAKQEAYDADVVYVSISTHVFDYLEDEKAVDESQRLMRRARFYANIDEIDNVLFEQALSEFIHAEMQGDLSAGETRRYEVADIVARAILARGGTRIMAKLAGRQTGVVLPRETLLAITPGQSSYADVVRLCGAPSEERQRLPDARVRMLVYRGTLLTTHRRRTLGWVATVSHRELEHHEVAIEIENDRVRDVEWRVGRTRAD